MVIQEFKAATLDPLTGYSALLFAEFQLKNLFLYAGLCKFAYQQISPCLMHILSLVRLYVFQVFFIVVFPPPGFSLSCMEPLNKNSKQKGEDLV